MVAAIIQSVEAVSKYNVEYIFLLRYNRAAVERSKKWKWFLGLSGIEHRLKAQFVRQPAHNKKGKVSMSLHVKR
jgi:hypothetical protein